MRKLTNPLNRDLESRLRQKVAKSQGRDVQREKDLDRDDIRRRIATYQQRWGEDPEL